MKWHHIGIEVRSLQESARFYERLFRFRAGQYLELPGESILFLTNGEITIELIKEDDPPTSFHSIHMCWEIENLDFWMGKLAVQGLSPSEGPLYLENGWRTVFYEGPNQEIIELIEEKKDNKFS